MDRDDAAGQREDPRPRLWGRRDGLVLLLLLLAASPHCRDIKPHEPLTVQSEPDGFRKLQALDRDPSVAAMLSWFVGDEMQGLHEFRPLGAASLWLEYRLWGWTRWPYQVVNYLLLALCAYGLVLLGRALVMPEGIAVLFGVAYVARPTTTSHFLVEYLCTRSEMLCGLFGLLAFVALVHYLTGGGRRTLSAFAGCLLLSFLSKEMALGLGLAAFILPWAAVDPAITRERRVAGSATAMGICLLWLAWYAYASHHFQPIANVPPGHSFGDLWRLTIRDPVAAAAFWAANVCQPLGELVNMVRAGIGWAMLVYTLFYRQLALLVLWVGLAWGLWRVRPMALVVLLSWKACSYLPVVPLRDAYPWYLFVPHLLDGLLVVGGGWGWWHGAKAGERLAAWWDRRRTARAPDG